MPYRWLIVAALVAACGSSDTTTKQDKPPEAAVVKEAPKPPAPPPAAPAAPQYVAPVLPADANAALTDPSKATETAPASYTVKFTTTKGDFEVKINREWAPLGADRFYNLVKIGFYNDASFFRVVDGFMVQFGISSYPAVNEKWTTAKIQDDPNKQPNTRGRISFATSGPNSRTGQVFINFVDNQKLDGMGFSPFGEVVSGMDVVDKLYKGYGEGAPGGKGPRQNLIQKFGKGYLEKDFPEMDYIKTAVIK